MARTDFKSENFFVFFMLDEGFSEDTFDVVEISSMFKTY